MKKDANNQTKILWYFCQVQLNMGNDEEVNPNLDVYIYWGLKKRLEDARTMMPNNQEQMLVETEPKPKFLTELVLVLSELANKVE